VLLPTTCPVCGARGPSPCAACRSRLRPPPALPVPPGADACLAAFAYAGVGREVVARLKYRNARSALPFVAARMAALVEPSSVDVVTWAPTAAARRRRRGFDQAQLLARAVGRRLGVPCRGLLRRRPGAPPQTGRSLAQRREGPAFDARRPVAGRVLVVDDVVTSGATATAAAGALRGAGAAAVVVVVAARTPPPRSPVADVHSARVGSWSRGEGAPVGGTRRRQQ
jgi:predicted amidophosphoribosyltransferase